MPDLPEPELWSNEIIAEFLLSNSLSEEGYRFNLGEVLDLGVDPLSLNPDHLFRDEPWQRAEVHQGILRTRRTS